MPKFLNNINLETANDIQFKKLDGTNAGKISQTGDDLVISNAVGDILLGNGSDDVYIGDGTNAVDIRFEQNMAIFADSGSTKTLTLGGNNTNLVLDSPTISGTMTLGATTINNKLTFTTANGYILFDYEPSGDGDEYTNEVPLIKIDKAGQEKTILSRISENGALQFGHDDTVLISAGDVGDIMKTNWGATVENVVLASEGGFYAYGFPNNDTTWSNRNEFRFRSDSATAGDNGLYIGDGSNTQFIDLSRNLTVGTIASGAITSTKSSSHTTQGSFSASDAHLDLYNSLAANTDQKGSILTFTDNYYDGSSYHKTTRAGIKGGTDTTGNTADGYLEFYTDSGAANSPNLALRLDSSQNATFQGKVVTTEVESSGALELDATADITIDAGGGDIILSDDGEIFGTFSRSGNDLQIRSRKNDGDMLFRGVDNSTEFTALTLDMSSAGKATFNSSITGTDFLELESSNDTGHVNSYVLMNATQSDARGAGVYMHNTNADKEFYAGVPYSASFDEYVISYQSTADHSEDTATTGNAVFRLNSSGLGTFAGGVNIGGHTVNDIDITSESSDADDHLMTALAIKNRIEDYGYITSSGNTSGNAATATALATARSIGGVSFDGTASINLPGVNTSGNQDTSGTAAIATTITVADESSDTSCNVVFVDTATGNRAPKTGTNLTFNSASGILSATGFSGSLTGNVTGNVSGNASGTAAGLSALDSENSITGHGVIVGNSDGSGITQVTGNALATNKFLRSRGSANAATAPTFETVDYASVSGTPTLGSLASANNINNSNWSGTDLAVANGGTGASSASGARTNLGLAIGSDVQAYDAQLADVAGLAVTDGGFIVGNGSNFVLESGATARTSLGLGTGAVLDTASIADGGTGLATADQIHTFVTGLGYVTSSGITSVDDSSANTAFPVVFHDESNGLLDDTGTFTYNPSTEHLSIPQYISHSGDGDTYIRFTDNNIQVMMGDTDYTYYWNAAYTAVTSGILASFGNDFVNHDSGLELVTDDVTANYGTYGNQTWDRTTLTFHGDFLKFKNDHDGTLTEVMTLDKNGRIGLGQVSPLFGVHDSRASGVNSDWYLVNGSIGVGTTPHSDNGRGDFTGIVTASNVTSGSDARIKKDIKNIPSHLALDVVKQLQGVRFNWLEENDESDWPELHKPKKENGVMELGFIAQDVEKVLPEVVETDDYRKGFKTVEYAKMVAVLTEAIKEQQKQIDELKYQINQLK